MSEAWARLTARSTGINARDLLFSGDGSALILVGDGLWSFEVYPRLRLLQQLAGGCAGPTMTSELLVRAAGLSKWNPVSGAVRDLEVPRARQAIGFGANLWILDADLLSLRTPELQMTVRIPGASLLGATEQGALLSRGDETIVVNSAGRTAARFDGLAFATSSSGLMARGAREVEVCRVKGGAIVGRFPLAERGAGVRVAATFDDDGDLCVAYTARGEGLGLLRWRPGEGVVHRARIEVAEPVACGLSRRGDRGAVLERQSGRLILFNEAFEVVDEMPGCGAARFAYPNPAARACVLVTTAGDHIESVLWRRDLHRATRVLSRDRLAPGTMPRVAWAPSGTILVVIDSERARRFDQTGAARGAVRWRRQSGPSVAGARELGPDVRALMLDDQRLELRASDESWRTTIRF